MRTASDFVAAILAIEFHVAVEGARDALVLRLALEFVVAARRTFSKNKPTINV